MMTQAPLFTRLDTAFARFLSRRAKLDGEQKQIFEQLVMQLSSEQSQGHNCIQINDDDKALVLASGLAACAGTMPLIVEKNRLYTHRYWHYEYRLAMRIKAMMGGAGASAENLEQNGGQAGVQHHYRRSRNW